MSHQNSIPVIISTDHLFFTYHLYLDQNISLSLFSETPCCRGRQKPKMEVILTKSDKFDEIVAVEAKEEAARKEAAAAKAAANGTVEAEKPTE